MAAQTLERRETNNLIGSDKVEGTNVYRSNGDKIGSIERIMLDKQSGKVAYAVMSFGGFLGIGHDHYPVPWSLLTYNTKLGGYEVNISDQQLKGAPSYSQRQRLGLGRPQARPAGLRLLPRAAVLDVTRPQSRLRQPPRSDSGRGGFHVRPRGRTGARGCATTLLRTGTRSSTACCSASACSRSISAR